MEKWVIGSTIRNLRERAGMTQVDLAARLDVSDKAVSKWETGRGYPDITLMEPLARELRVSVTELLAGNVVTNRNVSANMLRTKFYACPLCGNVMVAAGEVQLCCHGISLPPLEPEPASGSHPIEVGMVEDELYVRSDHPMDKSHHATFLAAVSPDRVQLVRLYPEGPCETRFRRAGVRDVYLCCNRDGLFRVDVRRQLKR